MIDESSNRFGLCIDFIAERFDQSFDHGETWRIMSQEEQGGDGGGSIPFDTQ